VDHWNAKRKNKKEVEQIRPLQPAWSKSKSGSCGDLKRATIDFGGYHSGAIFGHNPFRTTAGSISIAILGKKTVGTSRYNLNKYSGWLK
jgi:hypothetical protein